MSPIQQRFVRNRLLSALAPDDFASLQPQLEPVSLKMREIIIEPNQPIEHVYFIERGITSVLAEASGGRIEVGMIGSEGLAGLSALLGVDMSPHAFMVQAEGEALRLPAAPMRAAYQQRPGINAVIGRFIHAFMVQTSQTAYANATLNVEARLARWILMTQDRLSGRPAPDTRFLVDDAGRAPCRRDDIHARFGRGQDDPGHTRTDHGARPGEAGRVGREHLRGCRSRVRAPDGRGVVEGKCRPFPECTRAYPRRRQHTEAELCGLVGVCRECHATSSN